MKKLFSTIFVVLLVLCMASTALATGWPQIVEPAEATGNFTLKITALEYEKTNATGGSYYREWSGAVVEGTKVRFVVTMTTPETVPANFDTLALDIAVTNITLTEGEIHHDGFVANQTYTYFYAGFVTQSGDANATAKLSIGRKFVDKAFTFTVNGTAFVVTHNDDNYLVAIPTGAVKFMVNDAQKITNIYVGEKVVTYALDGSVNLTADEQKVLATVYEVLGFSLDGTLGYMYEDGFTALYGGADSLTVAYTYKGGAVVVTNPTVEPPQTGDAYSPAGYIMLALALAVAVTMAVRKVRN